MLKWYQEPLIHFLILGTFLFFLTQSNTFSMLHTGEKDITIKKDEITKMITFWEKKYHTTPTQEELDILINSYIENETLYRKALDMKLDQHDEGIKKLLIDKLKYIVSDPINIDNVSTKTLKKFFHKNTQLFTKKKETNISFRHIYLNPKKHDNIEEKSVALYEKIKYKEINISHENYANFGDSFYKGSYFSNINSKKLSKIISHSFFQDLQKLPLKRWSRPIASGYGIHLIYIEKIEHIPMTFETMKASVKNNYVIYNAKQKYGQFLKKIKNEYQVHIEPYSLSKDK